MKYRSVQEMFSGVAAELGPQVAIEHGGRSLTYSDLEEESNRLANFLLESGLYRGGMVGLFTDNPAMVITGILGVLKAGGVFVPLDPTFPEGRLQMLSDQVQPEWFVSANKHLEKLKRLPAETLTRPKVICLDGNNTTSELTANGLDVLNAYTNYNNTTHPTINYDPDAPCSIYFTSGSTGKPKAILGRLKGIDHFMNWEIEAAGAGPGTRVSQLASPSFDGFLKDAFVPLCSGGTVCAPESRDIILDAASLADWLDVEQIEVLHCVPSVFRALTNQDLNSRYFEAMKSIVLTGEPLYPADVKRWMDTFGERIKLFNIYGTTETSLSKFAHEVKPEDADRSSIPVGQPIKGAAVMLINSRGQLCREEAVGEIHIRTPYRSHGYYREPELTREVFIQNPFSDDPADIVHKTGDFGRLLKNGELEILGRRDQQVKVRGVRIELGEIENLLSRHDAVADVAVVDRDDADGNKFLVAYVTMTNGTGSEELRDYLAKRLPETMVPSAFVELDQLPRTLNGKIDRKALPTLDVVHKEPDADANPRTPIEEILAGIWREVLHLPRVGRRSNFFNLGGHSLLATQVILRVRNTLHVELPVRSIFEAPTIEQLSLLIQEQIGEGGQNTLTPIQPVPRDGELPLSFAQRRLWFAEQITRGTTTFHIPLRLRLEGALNVAALEHTFGEIVRRHEILRTVFPDVMGEPVQVIQPPAQIPIALVDLSGLAESERELAAERLANAENARLFHLGAGPLARLLLIRFSAGEHMLVCTLHHIISDGWSKGVLIKEISALYKAFGQGEPSPLVELPIQYADFGAWQRSWLSGDTLERELSYWKEKLAGAPAMLELNTDRPRPAVQTYRGSVVPVQLSQRVTEELKRLGQRHDVTLFMTLLAGFQTLLHRYTAQEEIVVGATVANRERVEIEGLIGCFVNLIALRTSCSGDPPFEELLEAVRETTLKAYAHQGVPFEKLIEELQPARRPGYAPLVQAICNLQNQPNLTELTLPGLTLSFPSLEFTTSEFDLILDLSEGPEGLTGALGYNSDLFDRETMVRMAQHLVNLLEGVAADPAQRLASLPLLSANEQRTLLEVWGRAPATDEAHRVDHPIHTLFDQQVARTPDRIAVVCGDERLTYSELKERADRLAQRLRSFGAGPDMRVGIHLQRSAGMVVAVLGVLKSGAAYVPLDLSYPFDRLAFMLEDSGIPLLVTDSELLDALPAGDAMPICLDDDEELWTIDTATGSAGGPEDLAYVIYTSGSTGRPKGVMVEHRAAVNLAFAHQQAIYRYHHSASGLRVSLNAPLAFDSCVERLLLLLFGHTVYVVTEEVRQDPDAMLAYVERHGLDVLDFTPSQLRPLIDAGLLERPGVSTRLVLIGGEPIDEQLWQTLAGQDRVHFFNVYGPTECTINASVCRISSSPEKPVIGRPLANVEAYILDERQQPVPAGIPGELCIGGAGLARGYLARTDATAEKFVPHPFATCHGERIYRTGDRARFLPDGQIEFLGRADNQVKIRGFRVELGEIEGTLLSQAGVAEAVVVARDYEGGKRLAAYVVAASRNNIDASVKEIDASGDDIDLDALRQQLAQRLPDYMVPSTITLLEALPLDLNGKLDRKALPEPQARPVAASREPRTPHEEILCSLFAEVLGLDHVGIDDHFFELGGHSLLAVRLISMVRSTLGLELDITTLFESPTPALLSLRLSGARIARQPSVRSHDVQTLPLSYAQQRLWFIQQLVPDSYAYNIPMAVRLTGSLDVDALNATLSEVIRRHEVLRTTFSFDHGQPQQVIHPPVPLELPVTDLTCGSAATLIGRMDEARRIAEEEARLPFDLRHAPPLRARLLRLDAHEHVLLFTMHHIASDGWSFDVFIREVGTLYPAFIRGDVSPLTEPPIQYADYALWERERLQSEELDQRLAYWRERLAGAPPVLELPADRPRAPSQSFRGAQHSFLVPADLTNLLKQLSRREGVTLFMTLLAAFKVLLHRYTRRTDVIVGSPIAGRNFAETEGLIGFFVNTLVLRTSLAGDPTFRELLERVRTVALGAYAQEVPFEKLVEEIQPERHTTHSPIFQVMFEMQNAPGGKLELPGLDLEPLKLDMAAAKFDLTLSMEESDQGIAGILNYSTDIFEAETIRRMADHLLNLLDDASAHAEKRVSELELLSAGERRQLTDDWNDTQSVYPEDKLIHELIELQVERQPEAIAIVFAGEQITYQELNRRAELTAQNLRAAGVGLGKSINAGRETLIEPEARIEVGPEVLIGVALERSIEMVVALLGVLKAGGAFVSFDLTYPKERLSLMFEETRAPLLLTRERLLEKLPKFDGALFFPDADGSFSAAKSVSSVSPSSTETQSRRATEKNEPERLAYVFYTSGSTGEPKGVLAHHRGVVNYLTFNAKTYHLEAEDTVLQLASPSFDASIRDTLGPLIAGARLVLVNDAGARDPQVLLSTISEQRVTCLLSVVPSLLSVLTNAAAHSPTQPTQLRLILTSGESLPLADCAKARHAFGEDLVIVNQYGPTECTMTQTFYAVPNTEEPKGVALAGRPIANTQLYILDQRLNLVPAGIPGDVYIGGAGVGRGYLHSPAITAEKFIPSPISREPGARLYRTGDLARFRHDGQIELLGRADDQIKLRGLRIEPAEVESALLTHNAVRDAAVVAHDDGVDRRLVAYVVSAPETKIPSAPVLREHLRRTLPEYLIPSAFVTLDALPLTPNGKVDRRALPAPARNGDSAEYVAPRTKAERALVAVWEEVLGRDRAGVGDNFFESGGHSLLATQLLWRIRETFGVELPMRTLFERPTISMLAESIETILWASHDAGVVADEAYEEGEI